MEPPRIGDVSKGWSRQGLVQERIDIEPSGIRDRCQGRLTTEWMHLRLSQQLGVKSNKPSRIKTQNYTSPQVTYTFH